MSFGKAPAVPIHSDKHPLGPRTDRDLEASRPSRPPVPRAPRAAPRRNTAGALAHDTWTRNDSESRRSREDSPFARISALSREQQDARNQVMEFGPKIRDQTGTRGDHTRAHMLAGDAQPQQGMPWLRVDGEDAVIGSRDAARRHTLMNEQRVQEQKHVEANPNSRSADPRRVDVIARENSKLDNQMLEVAASLPLKGQRRGNSMDNGRRNVLQRERVEESYDMPFGVAAHDGGVPYYGRRSVLQQHNPTGASAAVC
mmetsp:Transcript_38715/g.89362  ORF Transcript_38715/g.89362 Transcript_38715/m.89362 type:complete len:257 (+) Transcript_38715:77-847(+)